MIAHHAKGGDPTTENYVVTGGFFDKPKGFQNTGQGWWNEEDTAATVRTPEGGDSLKANVVAYRTNAAGQVDPQGDLSAAITSNTDPCTQILAYEPLPFDPRNIHHPANHSSLKSGDHCHPLRAIGNAEPAIAYRVHGENSTAMTGNGDARVADPVDVARALDSCGGYATNQGGNIVNQPMRSNMQVRRLTPVECSRLQGVPDDHLNIMHNGKPLADGNKYRLLGNGFAVPVVAWIGKRIAMVEGLNES